MMDLWLAIVFAISTTALCATCVLLGRRIDRLQAQVRELQSVIVDAKAADQNSHLHKLLREHVQQHGLMQRLHDPACPIESESARVEAVARLRDMGWPWP